MSSASAPGLPGSTKSAARMLDVTGLVVQSAGATTENGPSASRPSPSLSSALGELCSGTEPCGLPPMPACGSSAACGLSMPACGLGGAFAAGAVLLPVVVPDCQSEAGGSSLLGDCFLHAAPRPTPRPRPRTSAGAISRAAR